MALVDVHPLAAGARPPVDPADAVAGRERADVGELDPLPLGTGDLAAGERGRVVRLHDAQQALAPGIGAERQLGIDLPRRRQQPERAPDPHVDEPDPVGTPALAGELVVEPSGLPRSEPERVRPASPTALTPSGSTSSSSTHSAGPSARTSSWAPIVPPSSMRAVSRLKPIRSSGRGDAATATPSTTANGTDSAANAGRPSASAASRPTAASAAYPASLGLADVVRRTDPSCVGGTGTVSSRSRTTSSALTCCTQSSGCSVSLCASAGTAIAFTSSGVTKSRPWSAAERARELEQRQRTARRGTDLDLRSVARGRHEVDHVRGDRLGDVHLFDRPLKLEQRLPVADDAAARPRRPAARPARAAAGARRPWPGYPIETRIRNRSSWASGRGYVPSYSIGFWVASTMNGRSSGWVCPSAVTWCSCIASRSAACVFGGARLISSARRRFAKTGPAGTGRRHRAGRRSPSP